MNSSTHPSRFLNSTETCCAEYVPAGNQEPGPIDFPVGMWEQRCEAKTREKPHKSWTWTSLSHTYLSPRGGSVVEGTQPGTRVWGEVEE